VNALRGLPSEIQRSELRLYVTLEPCSHHGKTPPCAEAISNSGIPEVYIGVRDPNPLVAGRGIERLRAGGCLVETGVLESDCRRLHRRFLSMHEQQRPYITLKWARSIDGFIAPEISGRRRDTRPYWISNAYSRQLGHMMRTRHAAILVGSGTALADNPLLSSRDWHGTDPLRILIDRGSRVAPDARIFSEGSPTWIFSREAHPARFKDGVQWIRIPSDRDLIPFVLEHLREQEIQSLLVEGGAAVWSMFLNAGLWDEIWEFVGSKSLNSGMSSPEVGLIPQVSRSIDNDILYIYYRDKKYSI